MLGAQPRQGVGMCHYTSRMAWLALVAGALACSDRPPGTAPADHAPPVAFDVQGNRQLLDPERPPSPPVIAVVPVETDFATAPAAIECLSCGGFFPWPPLPPPPPAVPGLYLTKAHFVDDFEGWLKGDRKSTRLNSSHVRISYAVFCLKKKKHAARLIDRVSVYSRHYMSQ